MTQFFKNILPLFLLLVSVGGVTAEQSVKPVKFLFIAGPRSHGFGIHEFYAGSMVLANALEQFVSEKQFGSDRMPKISATVHRNAKVGDSFALDDADVIIVFCDGGRRYPLRGLEDQLEKLRLAGKGFVFLHYALCGSQGNNAQKPPELPSDAKFILKATGGVYEIFHSVNPSYTAEFKSLPVHPITRGVRPFAIDDEWYFNMRFLNESTEQILAHPSTAALQAVLAATPPDALKQQPDGAHSGNPTVRERLGKPEILAWAFQREDGGRGFGFTGGDNPWNFAHPDYRKLLLNAIVWTAGLEVPKTGLSTPSPGFEDLQKNLDDPGNLTPAQKEALIKKINSMSTNP